MGTENNGFADPPEPAYEAAAQAGHELTQQRLYEAQNLLAKHEAEMAGRVLVDPDDLRVFFARLSRGPFLRQDTEAGQAERRLREAAGVATDGAAGGSGAANSPGRVSQDPGSVSVALSDAAGTDGAS
jgi:hypothetical protein